MLQCRAMQPGAPQPPPGHDRIVRQLSRAVARDAVHHAYLFGGPDGVGKGQMARWLSALLLCAEPVPLASDPAGRGPCGSCPACRTLVSGAHADVMEIGPADGSKVIKVDQVRQLIRRVGYAPLSAERRAIIVRPADRMDKVPANALLKTLEEPASYNTFILITAREHALLDTIRSRTQQVRFAPLTPDVVRDTLISEGVPSGDAAILGAASSGSVGLARALVDAGFVELAKGWLDGYLAEAPTCSEADALGEAVAVARAFKTAADPQTSDLALLLRTLDLGVRDALLLGEGVPMTACTWPERASQARTIVSRAGTSRLIRLMDRIEDARAVLVRPYNAQLVLEDLLLAVLATTAERQGTGARRGAAR